MKKICGFLMASIVISAVSYVAMAQQMEIKNFMPKERHEEKIANAPPIIKPPNTQTTTLATTSSIISTTTSCK